MSAQTSVRQTPESQVTIRQTAAEHSVVYLLIVGPFLALLVGIGLAIAGHGISWLDVGLAVAMYAIAGHGVTAGYHRLFTHKAFKAIRPLKIGLATAGSLAVQGSVIQWVADHRKHHQFADAPGDPHSPWRFGSSPLAVAKGLWWAHCGWLFARDRVATVDKYAPDLKADKDLDRIDRNFGWLVVFSLAFPPVFAFLVTGFDWMAALTALLWASLVRMMLLHHVTWSTNSICHMFGDRPFRSRDKATNFWPLAFVSMGESWHNLHHSDPTAARMGVDRGQIDSTARLIWGFEKLGWATDVRWPSRTRLDSRRQPVG